MAIAPPAATPSWGFIPVAAICLALSLLVIAATIVLALIPVYIRNKSVAPQLVSNPVSTTFYTGSGTLPTGPLSAINRAALEAALNNFIANQPGFSRCRINLESANVSNCPSSRRFLQKRDRRRRRHQQQHRPSSLTRLARQSSNCVDQRISTTLTLTCPSVCVGQCLNNKANQLQSLLPNFSSVVIFPDNGMAIPVGGSGVPLSPTSTITTTSSGSTTTTTTTFPMTTPIMG